MSVAQDRNFGLASRERQRRLAELADDPYDLAAAQAVGQPGWNAFFGALREKADDAHAQGLNFRADISGIGRPATNLGAFGQAGGGVQYPSDVNAVATNKAAADDATENGLRTLATDAAIDVQRQQALADMRRSYADQVEASMNAPPIDQPNISLTTRPDAGANAVPAFGLAARPATADAPPTITMRPASSDPMTQMLARMPLAQRLVIAQQQAGLDALRAKTSLETAQAGLNTAKAAATSAHGGSNYSEMSPDDQKAVDEIAPFFAQTGRLPVGFRVYGEQGSFLKVVAARAKELTDQSGTTLAGAGANFAANEGSLKKLQATYDAAQSFLTTADRNSQLLDESLKRIPDTRSPLFNRPLRAFAQQVQGDPNMSQFATYLASVQNEYGKIIQNPSLAGQLTDAARHEAQALMDPNATVPQILSSLKALRSEGGNRLQSLDDQVKRVQGRISGQPSAPAAPPAPGGGGLVAMVAPDGRPLMVPAEKVPELEAHGAKRRQ